MKTVLARQPSAAPEASLRALRAASTAALIAAHFQRYNDEFRRITRRAAQHFGARDWAAAQRDAVARIELYEQCVSRCVQTVADKLRGRADDPVTWETLRAEYEQCIRRESDGDFYRTFFNSVCRDLFGTVGVNPRVEFSEPGASRAFGAVPIRVYPVSASLSAGLRDLLEDLPFRGALRDLEASVAAIQAQIELHAAAHGAPPGAAGPAAATPDFVEMIEPVFYRGTRAFLVGRLIGNGSLTPLAIALRNDADGIAVDAVILERDEIQSLFGFARSYFHVDLPVVGAAVSFLRSFMPSKPVDELYTILGRAKQGKTERYFALRRHLEHSTDQFTHAAGERGLVMIVFTLPSHDLVFKVIRDRFGPPKTSSRAEVMERYQFVFRHDRAGRMVDAQEFRRLRLPRARFDATLAEELLGQAADSCRADGGDLIIEHCYIERRLRPLNLYLRESDPLAAEAAVIDYGNALKDLAATNLFPGDLLLKNFGVTRNGRVIFYDYDEIALVSDCSFRDLPTPSGDAEETSAEPWFYVAPNDVFPEQWLTFFSMSGPLRAVFTRHHADLLTAAWWRELQAERARGQLREVLPYTPISCTSRD